MRAITQQRDLNLGTCWILVSLVVGVMFAQLTFCHKHSQSTTGESYAATTLETNGLGDRERRAAGSKKRASPSCCVCSGAVYRATFISKWNQTSHPQDFPAKLAHFSSVIGGTHRGDHTLWRLGAKATEAVKKFSEWGDMRHLLKKIKRRNYLGVIKTSPVWHRHKPVSMKFRADKTRHYLSILSKITPSPDWFVGIDRLDLCNATTCEWEKNVTIQLTPIDAGTDSGLKFLAANSETKPSELIHRLSPNYPNHPDASFFNYESTTIVPLAEFRIQFLHHKKKCNKKLSFSAVNCKVSQWSSWTLCSNQCGNGRKKRGRVILVRPKNGGRSCPRIHRSRACRATDCRKAKGKKDCRVNDWSAWTSCSQTCGRARRVRRRNVFVQPQEGGRACPKLVQKRRCELPLCPRIDCQVTDWSSWNPCSQHCGKGKRRRLRSIIKQPSGNGNKCPRLREAQTCNDFPCRGKSGLSSLTGK